MASSEKLKKLSAFLLHDLKTEALQSPHRLGT